MRKNVKVLCKNHKNHIRDYHHHLSSLLNWSCVIMSQCGIKAINSMNWTQLINYTRPGKEGERGRERVVSAAWGCKLHTYNCHFVNSVAHSPRNTSGQFMENAINSDLLTVPLEAWNCAQAMNTLAHSELFQSHICKSTRSPSWFFNCFERLHGQDENVLLCEWETSVAGRGSTGCQEAQPWGVLPYGGPLLFSTGTSHKTSDGWFSSGLLAGKRRPW